LYWRGSGAQGNPGLKAETSLGAEAGFNFISQMITIKIAGFSNHVDDWISWTPKEQYWTPLNIKKVWSRGIETQVAANKHFGAVYFGATVLYSFTKSTNIEMYEYGSPDELNKQLLLTPVHEGSITIETEWHRYVLRIVNSYTGKQLSDNSNSRSSMMDDYTISNVWLGKTVQGKKLKLTFTAEINNVFNVEYFGRPGYPLPGRNYKAGIQLNFHKQTKV
jgi:vitamin B12 transporter